ncbi:hypothetical protein C482_14664, partial [Natrialba chahannaoensis JCM 10990]
VEETEDYQDSLRDDSDTSIGIPGGDDIPDFGTGSPLAGVAIIGAAVAVVVGVVTNLLPFGGD